MTQFISQEFELPTHWASYLINGDEDSVTLHDINIIDAFINETGLGSPVSVGEETFFLKYHDAVDYTTLATNCSVYTFLERVDDMQHEPSLSAADRNPSMLG